MNTRIIVTVMAAALLSSGLVSVSSAQDERAVAPDGLEVITIIGKRPAPALATACMSEVASSPDNAIGANNGIGKPDEGVSKSGRRDVDSADRAAKHCNEQAVTVEAQI